MNHQKFWRLTSVVTFLAVNRKLLIVIFHWYSYNPDSCWYLSKNFIVFQLTFSSNLRQLQATLFFNKTSDRKCFVVRLLAGCKPHFEQNFSTENGDSTTDLFSSWNSRERGVKSLTQSLFYGRELGFYETLSEANREFWKNFVINIRRKWHVY